MRRQAKRSSSSSRIAYYVVGAIAIAAVVAAFVFGQGPGSTTPSPTSTHTITTAPTSTAQTSKPEILYVNQGNGAVNSSNFQALLNTARSHGFNTIFFQAYRSGSLLLGDSSLASFGSAAHAAGLKFFLALYFTDPSQAIPTSIYGDGEDGINLDMSTLPSAAQASLLSALSTGYKGQTAITTTNPGLTLRPDLLIVETYGAGNQQYIHHGIIASVGVFATTDKQDYDQQFSYALNNSDGVMVFDYAGLVKSGY